MKKYLLFNLCILFSAATFSQTPAETNINKSGYPKIMPDNSVEFSIKAPEAHKIQVDLGQKFDMVKSADGIWTVTTTPQSPSIHYYSLIVDGLSVADPSSESFYGCGRMMSCIEIPYVKQDTRFQVQNVAHGDIRIVRYYSNVTKSWRVMYIYTPAGYDKNMDKKYPVIYIMHGGGEDARGWVQQGRSDIILDNLIAEGKAKPMMLVSFDANVGGFDNVKSEILDNVIPFVENNFKADASADSRALAGLSMGGMYTLYVGVPNTDKFHHLGVFSSGWFAQRTSFMSADKERDANYSYMDNNSSLMNNNLKNFFITIGGKEDIAYGNCQIMMQHLNKAGIKFEYFDSKAGGHTWPVWREDLYLFAQKIFK
ncbi:enterochelin esterase-like enzyme [Xylanibacter oryzae DSM 17970]|uniref:Enterochelin esterase-like enzyme n=1 Tax=Xylanibacter oryzae DSM 17970 TaxID=915438 RepID=A0ABN0RU75_9BACT|nr:alpha/beta hydrolase-fold protein [Xylanibacter oryzae]EXG77788.1 enterochelin esterase-like enzyme [Xylanibacter oryzae DSM 17970]